MVLEDIIVSSLLEGLLVALVFAAVPLLTSLIVGLCVSIFQAATQIGEHTLSFVPKLASVVVVMFFFGEWLIEKLNNFTQGVLLNVAQINLQ